MERLPYRLMGAVALLITSAPISAAIIFDGNDVPAAADINAGNGSSSGGDFIFIRTNFADTGVNEYELNGSFRYNAQLLTFIPTEPVAPFGAFFLGVGLSFITTVTT